MFFKIAKKGYDIYKVSKRIIKVANVGLKSVNNSMKVNNIIIKTLNNQYTKDDIDNEIKRHFEKFKNYMPQDIKEKFEYRNDKNSELLSSILEIGGYLL